MKPLDTDVTSLSAITHILQHSPDRARWLCAPVGAHGRASEIIALAKSKKVEVRNTSEIVLRVLPYDYAPWEFIGTLAQKQRSIVLLLDHIQDPQNFGALIRSAEAFGADAAITPKDRSALVTSAVYTASAGAIETLPTALVVNLGDSLERLKKMGFWIVGADLDKKATPPWKVPTFEKIALVVGAEYEGLGQKIKGLCDWICNIPIQGKIESLNVSAAAAAILYELSVRRQNVTL